MRLLQGGFLIFALFICGSHTLIIPEELPSILSIIYSNIPPIRNGFDTRFGVGFRLGQHADVQLVTEIGPQIETQALGEPERRRSAPASQYVAPTPKRRPQKQKEAEIVRQDEKQYQAWTPQNDQAAPQPESWLAKWHKSIVQGNDQASEQSEVIEPQVNREVDDPVMNHLKKLFKNPQ